MKLLRKEIMSEEHSLEDFATEVAYVAAIVLVAGVVVTGVRVVTKKVSSKIRRK